MLAGGRISTEKRSVVARDLLLLIVVTGILFFVALGRRDLWNPNEPIYGRAVTEMTDRGDWVVPTINGRVFADKPILYYWAARVSSLVFGRVDEFTLRVPSAIAGIASALLTYLLVLPYAGRRRALIASALLVTQYQVFWNARAIQMDVLILASTLGVLVPLTRMLDFGLAAGRAWMLAGLAAGLGFAAKGPVAFVIPGLAFAAYAFPRLRFSWIRSRAFLGGAAVAVAVASPWFLMLAWRGEIAILEEVLIRQNFARFVDAWDHQRPWWYYLPYLWTDFAPWSWLLPAALLMKSSDANEAKLHRLGWIWIVATIAFFSLSDSKRSPYILPIAPAVAFLAAAVIDDLSARRLRPAPRRIAIGMIAMVGLVFIAAAVFAFLRGFADVPDLAAPVRGLALIAGMTGLVVLGATLVRRRLPALAAASLFVGVLIMFLAASTWALPAMNSRKSARSLARTVEQQLDRTRGEVASYGLWQWRAEYAYYADRNIPNLTEPASLAEFWRDTRAPFVLVEDTHLQEARENLSDERIVAHRWIGGREAYLLGKVAVSSGPTPGR